VIRTAWDSAPSRKSASRSFAAMRDRRGCFRSPHDFDRNGVEGVFAQSDAVRLCTYCERLSQDSQHRKRTAPNWHRNATIADLPVTGPSGMDKII
jgi:hypothetical protein